MENNSFSNEPSPNSSLPWVEKYRPKDFDNIVLDPMNQKLFRNILEKNYFPNLLFYGPPGTGKTTTIINLINEYQKRYYTINKNLVIHLNASDERGIDIIRNQIYQFIKTKNMFDVGMKFVILDEVDYMTKNAQQALKYLLQTCSHNVRFCLICNYISKIEESLQNEFLCIRFNQLPKKDIYQFIRKISENESLALSNESIETIQIMFQSDIRSMINFIQLNHLKEDAISGENMDNIFDKKIIHQSCLEDLYKSFREPTTTKTQIKANIHAISSQYNIDKKSILIKYFHYLIQQKKYDCSGCERTKFGRRSNIGGRTKSELLSDVLDNFSVILHNNDVKPEVFLDYFIEIETSRAKDLSVL